MLGPFQGEIRNSGMLLVADYMGNIGVALIVCDVEKFMAKYSWDLRQSPLSSHFLYILSFRFADACQERTFSHSIRNEAAEVC
jgi:hypothetical protein